MTIRSPKSRPYMWIRRRHYYIDNIDSIIGRYIRMNMNYYYVSLWNI